MPENARMRELFGKIKKEATALADLISRTSHANDTKVLAQSQTIVMTSLLVSYDCRPTDDKMPLVLAAVTGDNFDEFCKLLS